MEVKRQKIQEILEGKGTEYESQSIELHSKALQIQEERVRLGRQIKDLKQARIDREKNFSKLENEIHIMKKESLVILYFYLLTLFFLDRGHHFKKTFTGRYTFRHSKNGFHNYYEVLICVGIK